MGCGGTSAKDYGWTKYLEISSKEQKAVLNKDLGSRTPISPQGPQANIFPFLEEFPCVLPNIPLTHR